MEKIYECKECCKVFAKYYDLKRHNKLHTGEHPYMCEICGCGFCDRNRLIIHVSRAHTGRKPFECSVCEKRFTRSSDRNRHMKVHEKEKFPETDRTLVSKRLENLSYKIIINDHPLSATESDMDADIDQIMASTDEGCAASDPDNDMKHELDHITSSSEENTSYIGDNILGLDPDDSNATGSSKLELTFQMESPPFIDERIFDLTGFNKNGSSSSTDTAKTTIPVIQNESIKESSPVSSKSTKPVFYAGGKLVVGKPYNCNYCEKSFTKSSDLKRHHMIHTGDRPFLCNLCGAGFIEKSKLIVHNRHHTGERPFECEVCGKTFIKKSDMTSHRKIHTGERNHVCTDCGKAFIKKSDLTRHIRLHTGERPFVCVICGAAFTESGKLKKHMVVHTGEKNAQCDTCGKFFSKNSDLRRHTRIHTGERPYKCEHCIKSFTYSQMYKEHLKKEHDIIAVSSRKEYTPIIRQSTSSTQEPSNFEDVVASINSSIVAPALSFIINQKGNFNEDLQQQQLPQEEEQQQDLQEKQKQQQLHQTYEVQIENDDVQISADNPEFRESLKDETVHVIADTNKPIDFQKWVEVNTQVTNIDYSNLQPKLIGVALVDDDQEAHDVSIKEEVKCEDNSLST